MLTNKKIKEKITEELRPDNTFDEFAEKHGIVWDKDVCATKKSATWKKVFFPVTATVAVALCIGLPFAFMNNATTPGMLTYGEDQTSFNLISEKELLSDKNVYMFDLGKTESYSKIRCIFVTEKKDLVLGYKVKNAIYGFEYENQFYVYDFDYLIRSYDGYYFTNIDMYNKHEHAVNQNGVDFSYTIDNNDTVTVAYISFEKGDYDYFVSVRGYEGMTDINDNSVELFIKNIFNT